ncbi:MAG: hypothetical protein ACM3ON_09300 [Chloroflexota bacterium]
MAREILRELIPVNLINLMVIAGFQYVNVAPDRVPADIEVSAEGLVHVTEPLGFWLFPVAAAVVYIVLTIVQFFYTEIFLMKTLAVFFIGDLEVSIMLYEIGMISSPILGMMPFVLLLVLYVWSEVFGRRRGAGKSP